MRVKYKLKGKHLLLQTLKKYYLLNDKIQKWETLTKQLKSYWLNDGIYWSSNGLIVQCASRTQLQEE